MSTFRRNSSILIQLHLDRTCTDDPEIIAEAFAKNLHVTHSHTSTPLGCIPVYCSHFLPLVPLSDLDIQPAVQRLRQTKSVAPDDIPRFIIKGSYTILVPVLRHIFSLSASQHNLPTEWLQSVIVPVYKKRNNACVQNYNPISHSTIFQNFEFVIHCHLSYSLKFKCNPSQNDSSIQIYYYILAIIFRCISPLFCSQHRADAILTENITMC